MIYNILTVSVIKKFLKTLSHNQRNVTRYPSSLVTFSLFWQRTLDSVKVISPSATAIFKSVFCSSLCCSQQHFHKTMMRNCVQNTVLPKKTGVKKKNRTVFKLLRNVHVLWLYIHFNDIHQFLSWPIYSLQHGCNFWGCHLI